MARSEKVSYWRGTKKNMPSAVVSGRLLFVEDTGEVYLDYKDYMGDGSLIRRQLVDSSKVLKSGDTMDGFLHVPQIQEDLEDASLDSIATPKAYVDSVKSSLNSHMSDEAKHVSDYDRNYWNAKVNKVGFQSYVPDGSAVGKLTINNDEFTIKSPYVTDIEGNAATASKLLHKHSIDGLIFDGYRDIDRFFYCYTSGDQSIKEVEVTGEDIALNPDDDSNLRDGTEISVFFLESSETSTFQIELTDTIDDSEVSFGPYNVYYKGEALDGTLITSGLYKFIFIADHFEVVGVPNHIIPEATTEQSGLMSAQDKAKFEEIKVDLDGDGVQDGIIGQLHAAQEKLGTIDENANYYVLPKATSIELGGVTVGSNITLEDGQISINSTNISDALGYVPASESGGGRVFEGATAITDGTAGIVPAPKAGDQDKVLSGGGSWEDMSSALPIFRKRYSQGYEDIDHNVIFNTDPTTTVEDNYADFPYLGDEDTLYIATDQDNQCYAWVNEAYLAIYPRYLGNNGLVPMPYESADTRFLRDDGQWVKVEAQASIEPISNQTIDDICVW